MGLPLRRNVLSPEVKLPTTTDPQWTIRTASAAMATGTTTFSDQQACRGARRLSTYHAKVYGTMRPGIPLCKHLPHSLEALDLSSAQISPALASLRLQVLSCLADLETQLSLFDSPLSPEALKARGIVKIEEAKAWAREGLEMLHRIRSEVYAHLPGAPSVEDFVKSHIPDVSGLSMHAVRARLSDVPDTIRSKFNEVDFSDIRSRLEDVRIRISELQLNYPESLSDHLQSLQTHLMSIELPFTHPNGRLSQLFDKVLASELVSEISSEVRKGEDKLERAAMEIAYAIKLSLEGSRLIHYTDLPERWRNNAYVVQGYRFIPLRQWPRLFISLFTLHNETRKCNILSLQYV